MARKVKTLDDMATLDPVVAERNARVLAVDTDEDMDRAGPDAYSDEDRDEDQDTATSFSYTVRPDGVVDNVLPDPGMPPTLDSLIAQEAAPPTHEQLTEALLAWRDADDDFQISKAEAKEAKERVTRALAKVQQLTGRLRTAKKSPELPDWVTEKPGQPMLPLDNDTARAFSGTDEYVDDLVLEGANTATNGTHTAREMVHAGETTQPIE